MIEGDEVKRITRKLSVVVAMLLFTASVQAQTIKEVVEHTLANNPKVMSAIKNNEAYRLYIDEAKGGIIQR